jgi:hypothetical protein
LTWHGTDTSTNAPPLLASVARLPRWPPNEHAAPRTPPTVESMPAPTPQSAAPGGSGHAWAAPEFARLAQQSARRRSAAAAETAALDATIHNVRTGRR